MDTVRRHAAAGSLMAAPLLLLASHLLQPAHGTSTAAEVATQARHSGAFDASTVVGFLAMLVLVPAVVTLAGLLRDRWSGHVGGALALSGSLGLTFLLGTGSGATTIARYGGNGAVSLTDHLQSNVGFTVAVAVMLVGWTFGLITLAVGLWRSDQLPAWAAAAIAAAPLVPAAAGSRVPVAISFVVLLAGFSAAARAVLDSEASDVDHRGVAPTRRTAAA